MGSLHKEITSTMDLDVPLVVTSEGVPTVTTEDGFVEFMKSTVLKRQELDEPFYVLDLGHHFSLLSLISNLPMVHPYYAVKGKLDKIRMWHSKCELSIRIKSPVDGGARYTLDSEFGANPGEPVQLLEAAEASRLPLMEAGRFFADLAFTLATKIIGKLVRDELRDNNQTTYKSTVFRPTCTAVGKVFAGHPLPELEVNDWLVFPDKGANTLFVEPISMDLAMLPFELKFSVRIQAHTACEYENEVILLHGFASEVTEEIKK
ncbi:hypothetical protein WN943_018263 [Citrus x changshan-huyou]